MFRRTINTDPGSAGPVQRVDDDTTEKWQRLPVVDTDVSGRHVIAWEDYRNTPNNQQADMYAQAFGPDELRIGKNVKVNDGDVRMPRNTPAIAMNDTGGYLVVWHQNEGAGFRVMGQWFSFPATRAGANFQISR